MSGVCYMKGLNYILKGLGRSLVLATVSCFLVVVVSGQQGAETPLTNAAVVKLVKAGFKEKTIISIIQSRPNRFNLETDQLVQLKRNGVSENVILAMLSFVGGTPSDEAWASDEDFFRGRNSRSSEGVAKEPQGNGGGVDIFGSSGGSNSQSSSRSEKGGSENEGTVTGSATVRIIRPPTEAGSTGPAKLEKTPTLNNESIVRLVEAGFSEGTIIKRIEESPVDFDLSPAKVDELHKRRVTDPIIAAMTVAMGDETPKTNPKQPEGN